MQKSSSPISLEPIYIYIYIYIHTQRIQAAEPGKRMFGWSPSAQALFLPKGGSTSQASSYIYKKKHTKNNFKAAVPCYSCMQVQGRSISPHLHPSPSWLQGGNCRLNYFGASQTNFPGGSSVLFPCLFLLRHLTSSCSQGFTGKFTHAFGQACAHTCAYTVAHTCTAHV